MKKEGIPMENHVAIKILRSEPQSHFDTYVLPFSEGLTLLGALRQIAAAIDPTLAFRDSHCGRGVCGACLVKVEGQVRRACCTPLEAGREYRVEPANSRVIRDLAVRF